MKEATVTIIGTIPIAQQLIEELGIASLFDATLEKGKEEIFQQQDAIEADAHTGGIFPLVTNTKLEAAEMLRNYKNQPYPPAGGRFNALKSVTPNWWKDINIRRQ